MSLKQPWQARFCLAMLMAMMVKDHGFSMIATVCSSWVFVSRSVMLGWYKEVKRVPVNIPTKSCSRAPASDLHVVPCSACSGIRPQDKAISLAATWGQLSEICEVWKCNWDNTLAFTWFYGSHMCASRWVNCICQIHQKMMMILRDRYIDR